MREKTKYAIIVAEKALEDGDPRLAVFMLRGLEDTKEKRLEALAWALYRRSCRREDIEYLIKRLREE